MRNIEETKRVNVSYTVLYQPLGSVIVSCSIFSGNKQLYVAVDRLFSTLA